MPDTVKKGLLGAVAGALLVVFVNHVLGERAKRDPAARAAGMGGAAPPAGKGPGGGGMGQAPVAVVAGPARTDKISFELEALDTAHATESVDITAKVVNQVTAVRFVEGQQVRRGDVLVELDAGQVRADLAVAEAALAESRSQYRRSRELYATKALSEAQLEQLEAALKADVARVAAARARLVLPVQPLVGPWQIAALTSLSLIGMLASLLLAALVLAGPQRRPLHGRGGLRCHQA